MQENLRWYIKILPKVNMSLWVCMCMCMCVCVYVCVWVCLCVHVYMCECVYVCIIWSFIYWSVTLTRSTIYIATLYCLFYGMYLCPYSYNFFTLSTVQLKGNLIPKCSQWIQQPKVILVTLVLSMQVPIWLFLCCL